VRTRTALALGASVLLGLPSGASALDIDTFDTSQTVLIPAGPPTPQTDSSATAAPEAIGGSREIILERTGGFGIAMADVDVSTDGVFSLSTGAAVSAVSTIAWDGGADDSIDYGGLGGIDVTEGGANDTLQVVVRSDLDATITIQFHTDNANDFLSAQIDVTGAGQGDGPFQTIEIPLASLVSNGAGADLTSIGAILAEATGPASVDLQIDRISLIPEPGTLVLMGLGVSGLTLLGRRRA
jgi:hypothetical protein